LSAQVVNFRVPRPVQFSDAVDTSRPHTARYFPSPAATHSS